MKTLPGGFTYEGAFNSEASKSVRKLLKAVVKSLGNSKLGVVYHDLTRRKLDKLPNCDVYIAGPPCTAYSKVGSRSGVASKPGSLLLHCVLTVVKKRPRLAILENVLNLVHFTVWKRVQSRVEKAGYFVKALIDQNANAGVLVRGWVFFFFISAIRSLGRAPLMIISAFACASLM